jgi:hypothetical protein
VVYNIPSWFLTTTIAVFMMSYNPSPSPPCSLTPVGDDLANQMMRVRLAEIWEHFSPPSTPTVDPLPAPTGKKIVAFLSQPPEFPTLGFQGGSFSLGPSSPRVSLGGVTPHSIDPCDVPLGVKPVGKCSLSGNAELSMFDILNIFCCWWFLSINHLRAQALSAQKAEDGKIF